MHTVFLHLVRQVDPQPFEITLKPALQVPPFPDLRVYIYRPTTVLDCAPPLAAGGVLADLFLPLPTTAGTEYT